MATKKELKQLEQKCRTDIRKKLHVMTSDELALAWQKKIETHLLGKSIIKVEYMSQDDADAHGWTNRPIQFLLNNGVWLTITKDDEGNDGGAIHTNIKQLSIIPVI